MSGKHKKTLALRVTRKKRVIASGCKAFVAVAFWVIMSSVSSCYAQETPDASAEQSKVDEQKPKQKLTLDLGQFQVRQLRPQANETINLQFSVHLLLTEAVDEKLVARLATWQHRLRNEVLTTLRAAETIEFYETDLALLRRKLLLRINRRMQSTIAEDVLFSAFTFRLE